MQWLILIPSVVEYPIHTQTLTSSKINKIKDVSKWIKNVPYLLAVSNQYDAFCLFDRDWTIHKSTVFYQLYSVQNLHGTLGLCLYVIYLINGRPTFVSLQPSLSVVMKKNAGTRIKITNVRKKNLTVFRGQLSYHDKIISSVYLPTHVALLPHCLRQGHEQKTYL